MLVFSVYDESVMVKLALRSGATGFVSKRCAPDVLREAVRSVFRGVCYLSEDVRAAGTAASPEAGQFIDDSGNGFVAHSQILVLLRAKHFRVGMALTLGASATIQTYCDLRSSTGFKPP